MVKALIFAVGVGVGCAGLATTASAMPRWEKALLERYVNHHKCTGKGAPAWGKRAMERWRAAQRRRYPHEYDAY